MRELLAGTLEGQQIAEPIKQRLLELMVARLRPVLNDVSCQMRCAPQDAILAARNLDWHRRILAVANCRA